MKNLKVIFIYLCIFMLTGYSIYLSQEHSAIMQRAAKTRAVQDSMLLDTTSYPNILKELTILHKRIDGVSLELANINQFNASVNAYVRQQMALNSSLDSIKTKQFFPPPAKKDTSAPK